MLEQIDLDLKVSKEDYKRRLPELQARLYDLTHAAFRARVPSAVVFEGWGAAGKAGSINTLTERLDPRGFRVTPVLPPRTFETRYPWLWRFWLKAPAYGQMVIYDTSWYRRVLIDRVTKTVRKREWQQAYQDIHEFEAMQAADGAVIVKFWLHISREEQARRFKRMLESNRTAWQVSDEDRAQHQAYAKYLAAVEEMLARTDMPHAPWTIVEATDRQFTRLKIFDTIIGALEARLGALAAPEQPQAEPAPKKPRSPRKKEAADA